MRRIDWDKRSRSLLAFQEPREPLASKVTTEEAQQPRAGSRSGERTGIGTALLLAHGPARRRSVFMIRRAPDGRWPVLHVGRDQRCITPSLKMDNSETATGRHCYQLISRTTYCR